MNEHSEGTAKEKHCVTVKGVEHKRHSVQSQQVGQFRADSISSLANLINVKFLCKTLKEVGTGEETPSEH